MRFLRSKRESLEPLYTEPYQLVHWLIEYASGTIYCKISVGSMDTGMVVYMDAYMFTEVYCDLYYE